MFDGGVLEAGEGEGGGPGGHGAGVVVAALGFVEGASFLAVVSVADILDAFEAVGGLAFVEHTDGGGVFEAGHDFGEIGEGIGGPLVGVGGHEEGGFVAEGVGAHVVEVVGHGRFVVIFHDAFEGGLDVLGLDEIAEAGDVGEVLADELIDQAASG